MYCCKFFVVFEFLDCLIVVEEEFKGVCVFGMWEEFDFNFVVNVYEIDGIFFCNMFWFVEGGGCKGCGIVGCNDGCVMVFY